MAKKYANQKQKSKTESKGKYCLGSVGTLTILRNDKSNYLSELTINNLTKVEINFLPNNQVNLVIFPATFESYWTNILLGHTAKRFFVRLTVPIFTEDSSCQKQHFAGMMDFYLDKCRINKAQIINTLSNLSDGSLVFSSKRKHLSIEIESADSNSFEVDK